MIQEFTPNNPSSPQAVRDAANTLGSLRQVRASQNASRQAQKTRSMFYRPPSMPLSAQSRTISPLKSSPDYSALTPNANEYPYNMQGDKTKVNQLVAAVQQGDSAAAAQLRRFGLDAAGAPVATNTTAPKQRTVVSGPRGTYTDSVGNAVAAPSAGENVKMIGEGNSAYSVNRRRMQLENIQRQTQFGMQ